MDFLKRDPHYGFYVELAFYDEWSLKVTSSVSGSSSSSDTMNDWETIHPMFNPLPDWSQVLLSERMLWASERSDPLIIGNWETKFMNCWQRHESVLFPSEIAEFLKCDSSSVPQLTWLDSLSLTLSLLTFTRDKTKSLPLQLGEFRTFSWSWICALCFSPNNFPIPWVIEGDSTVFPPSLFSSHLVLNRALVVNKLVTRRMWFLRQSSCPQRVN